MVLSAAIILPLILDGERPAELDVQVHVTSPPAFPTVDIATVQPVDSLPVEPYLSEGASADNIQLIPVPSSATEVERLDQATSDVTAQVEKAAPVEKAAVVEKTAPVVVADRWTLQIATFKSKDNAHRLVEKLKAANYAAYSVTTNSLYKVYAGPELKREASEKMREEIKKKFSLTGIVIKYSVN
ncbi:SPOR domain-containing protein [Marinomonas sp. M1K-6]|uniref:SPOR domain-containing protein n=2 Tax=Marinomonas profundi TaxID=2726122 RepID=A0A847RCA6_9GAMM|nr:SPOR domain-containing protein [Marinomonas profundi]UDV04909.1 SPOR domain-containing protein [Marinomonas profundi]